MLADASGRPNSKQLSKKRTHSKRRRGKISAVYVNGASWSCVENTEQEYQENNGSPPLCHHILIPLANQD